MSQKPSPPEPQLMRGWLSLMAAAEYLHMTSAALRRALERRAVRAPDGGIEANIDGVRARKFAGRWRVKLSAAWLADADNEDKKSGAKCGSSSRPKHAVRPERS